jgi:hypothetical protein
LLDLIPLVMISLKSAIPALTGIFANLSEHALYERQRSLMRAGLLSARKGRGPGSGVEVSPDTLGILMISLLATDSLSEVAEATRFLASARRRVSDANKHLFVGAKTLREAFALALSSDDDENQFGWVSASRIGGSAMGWSKRDVKRSSGIKFQNTKDHSFLDSKFTVFAKFRADAFLEIRELLKDISDRDERRLES